MFKIVLNTLWLTSGTSLKLALSFITTIFVARYLGPEDLGILSYHLAFAVILSPFVTFGLLSFTEHRIASKPQYVRAYLTHALLLHFITGVISALILSIFAITLIDLQVNIYFILFVSVNIVGMFYFNVIKSFLNAKLQSRIHVISSLLVALITSMSKFACIAFELPLIAFVIIFAFEPILLFICLKKLFNQNLEKVSLTVVKRKYLISLALMASPLMLSSIMVVIYMKLDLIMIGILLSPSETGYYSISASLAEAWIFIPIAIITSAYPEIAKYYHSDTDFFYRKVAKLLRIIAGMTLMFLTLVLISSDALILKLFGVPYAKSITALQILSVGSFFILYGSLQARYLNTHSLFRLQFYISTIGALSNVVLNIFLIPSHGIDGAALATVISFTIMCFLPTFFNKECRKFAGLLFA